MSKSKTIYNEDDWVKIKIKVNNENVQKAMRQKFEKLTLNPIIINDVKKLRSLWGIPTSGFNLSSKKFIEWITKHQGNNFVELKKTIKEVNSIKASPQVFLNKVVRLMSGDDMYDYPTDLYFLEDAKTFNALINEKPFPGIVHYIISNKLFIPETREAQLTYDKYGNIVLRVGPSATKRDIQELLPTLCWLQKERPGFAKGKDRISKLHEKNIKVYKNKLTQYNALDVYKLSEKRRDANKSLGNIRQRRKRFKEDINKK